MQPYWNPIERRPRAGWRVLIHFATWILTYSLVQIATGSPLTALIYDRVPELTDLTDRIVAQAVTVILFMLLTWVVTRYVDRRPLAQLGLQMDRRWWQDFGFGLLLGAGAMSAVFGVEYWAGWIEIDGRFFAHVTTLPFAVAILGPVMVFVVIGITEEVLFRGHQLRNLAEGLNLGAWHPRYAVLSSWLLSSAFFGLFHVFNPYSDWISTLNLAILGLMFGLGFILTGRLGLPIGLHITWNLFMGNVFGFPVSGNDFTSASVFIIRQHGPSAWTGGPFGPEAGLIGILAILVTSWAVVWWVRKHYGRIELDLNLARYEAGIGLTPGAELPTGDAGTAAENE
ncbi:MAG: CPBP family intramembrane glutamic endopeptidase [Litorilinea sp.]